MTGKRIGYIRVSTSEQNPDRQLEGLQIDKKFVDYASSRSLNRHQLKAMLEFVREDDTVIVHSMDRLARNVKDLRAIVDSLVARKINVLFVKENLNFDGKESHMSNLLLSIMGAFAEFELAFIMERQREGVAIAKKNGKYLGSKKALNEDELLILKEKMMEQKTKKQIAAELGISRVTMWRYIQKIREQHKVGA